MPTTGLITAPCCALAAGVLIATSIRGFLQIWLKIFHLQVWLKASCSLLLGMCYMLHVACALPFASLSMVSSVVRAHLISISVSPCRVMFVLFQELCHREDGVLWSLFQQQCDVANLSD